MDKEQTGVLAFGAGGITLIIRFGSQLQLPHSLGLTPMFPCAVPVHSCFVILAHHVTLERQPPLDTANTARLLGWLHSWWQQPPRASWQSGLEG